MNLSDTAIQASHQCHVRYHLQDNGGLPSQPRPVVYSFRALHGTLPLVHCGLKPWHGPDATLWPAPSTAVAHR
jgi:hypothetical protein